MKAVAVAYSVRGVDLAEPGQGPRRILDSTLARLTLRALGETAPYLSVSSPRLLSSLRRESGRLATDPTYVALLYEASTLAEPGSALAGFISAGLTRAHERASERGTARRSPVLLTLSLLGLARLGERGGLDCGPYATPVAPALLDAVRGLPIGRCESGAPEFPSLAATGDGLDDAEDLAALLVQAEGDTRAVARRLASLVDSHRGLPVHLASILVASCDGGCPQIDDQTRRLLRMEAATNGSGAQQVEALGFDSFAENALMRSLAYPAGDIFHDLRWEGVDHASWGSVGASEGEANVLMANLYVSAPTDWEQVLGVAGIAQAQRPGAAGALSLHYGDCGPVRALAAAIRKETQLWRRSVRLPPLARVGIALDLSQARLCAVGFPTASAALPRRVLDAPVSALRLRQPGGLHEAWASVEASCLVWGQPSEALSARYASAAAAYLGVLGGADFAFEFRVLDALAAVNLEKINDGGCNAGVNWWGEAPWG